MSCMGVGCGGFAGCGVWRIARNLGSRMEEVRVTITMRFGWE